KKYFHFYMRNSVLIYPNSLCSAYDTIQCLTNHGHCRRLCFHMERQVSTCTNGHQRCCK
uniref:Beta-defensin-like domain-containing protein n=1 Tax=Pelusios castaneus TaxID=367368 RepID=A0A8C8RQY1_9SAUR